MSSFIRDEFVSRRNDHAKDIFGESSDNLDAVEACNESGTKEERIAQSTRSSGLE